MEFDEDSGNRPRPPSGRDSPASENEYVDIEALALGAQEIAGMVVHSVEMRRVLSTIERLGPYKATVLVYGESGTGKELVARALHILGPVPKGPFVTFNCSNLVESLAESQLFGHVRGAFTDAREDSVGYFRAASGGTLFLDEIGELPLRLQPKLLRAVELHDVHMQFEGKTVLEDFSLKVEPRERLVIMGQTGSGKSTILRLILGTLLITAGVVLVSMS